MCSDALEPVAQSRARPLHAAGPTGAACAAVALVLLALLPGTVSGHVPEVGPGSRDLGATDRSWAFYDVLEAGDIHNWTFDLREGEPLFLSIGVPTGKPWSPQAQLTGPDGAIALVQEDSVGLEPFSPYAAREVWSLDVPAPATGSYQLSIQGSGGAYVFGFGLNERFSVAQWVGVPLDTLRIHAWQGQPLWPTLLVYVAAAASVLAMAWRQTDILLPRLGAALLMASAIDRLLQLGFAVAAGAQASWGSWTLAVGLALPAAGLAWGAWRARRAWTLLALSGAGLAAWAGFYIGPALLALASLRSWMQR